MGDLALLESINASINFQLILTFLRRRVDCDYQQTSPLRILSVALTVSKILAAYITTDEGEVTLIISLSGYSSEPSTTQLLSYSHGRERVVVDRLAFQRVITNCAVCVASSSSVPSGCSYGVHQESVLRTIIFTEFQSRQSPTHTAIIGNSLPMRHATFFVASTKLTALGINHYYQEACLCSQYMVYIHLKVLHPLSFCTRPLNHSNCHGQGLVHFDCQYFTNVGRFGNNAFI